MISQLNRHKGLLLVSIVALLFSFLSDSPWMDKLQYSIHYYRFERDLESKEEVAELALERMISTLSTEGIEAVRQSPFWLDLTQEKDISFFILEKGKQIYWTDPLVDMETIKHPTEPSVLIRLKNRLALSSWVSYQDYHCMALIKVRDMFPNTNELLQNDFARQFDLPLATKLVVKPSDKDYPLFNLQGKYLFSLSFSEIDHNKGSWMQSISVVFFILFLFLFFIWIKRVTLHPYGKAFLPLLCLWAFYGIGWPRSVFGIELFSPHIYTSDFLLRSLGDLLLLIFSLSYISGIVSYWVRQRKIEIATLKRSVWILIGCFAFFFLMLCGMILLQKDLINNSSFVVIPEKLTGVSGYTLCTYLIYFGIIFSLCEIYRTIIRMIKDQISAGLLLVIKIGFLFVAGWVIVPVNLYPVSVLGWFLLLSSVVDFTIYGDRRFSFPVRFVVLPLFFSLFIADFSSGFSKERMEDKMSVVAENMALGLGREFDPYAQMLLKEIDAKLKRDTLLAQMVDMEEDETEIVSYLRREYFGGFFQTYRLNVYNCDDDQTIDLPQGSRHCKEYYQRFKTIHCKPLPETRFFYHKNKSLPGYLIQTDYTFTSLYIELIAQPGSKAYRYSALLTDTSNPGADWYSTARYYKGKLMMQTGDYEYPFTDEWRVAAGDKITLVMNSGGYTHYLYCSGADYSIVVSQPDKELKSIATMITFLYLMFLVLLIINFIIYRLLRRERLYPSTFQSRFQRWFTIILLISCAATGFFSIWFYATLNYSEQVQLLISKTTMIKKQIETMNTTSGGLSQMLLKPDFFLQEMSARNEVDILLYSPDGRLLGSFSPILLNKGLIGKWISPLALIDLQNHRSEVILQEHTGRLEYVSCYMSIRDKNNDTIAYLNLPWYVSTHKMEEEVSNFVLILLNIYMIIILLVMLANYFIIRRIAHPLQMIGVGLNQVGLHAENLPMSYKYDDEIGQLVNRYNQMLIKLEESAALLAKSERESAWKEMARQVAHEINNPLTPMRLTIQQLVVRREKSADTFDAYLAKASVTLIEQIDTLSAIATEFSKFARLPDGVLQPMDIHLCIENVVHLFTSHKEELDIDTDFIQESPLIIFGDKEQLTRVFNNLIKNAIQSIPSTRRGAILISTRIEAQRVYITISDNGTGVDLEFREKLFTPNFTTKSSGMGLGLTIVKHHVEQSEGKIQYYPLEEGSSFVIDFPLIDTSSL